MLLIFSPFWASGVFFLSAFFFFCRHVFLLCLFLGVSLIFLVAIYYRMEIPLLARFLFLLYAFFTAFRLLALFYL